MLKIGTEHVAAGPAAQSLSGRGLLFVVNEVIGTTSACDVNLQVSVRGHL